MKFLSLKFLHGFVLPLLLVTSLAGLSACTTANRGAGESQVREEPGTMQDRAMTDDAATGDQPMDETTMQQESMQQEETENTTDTERY